MAATLQTILAEIKKNGKELVVIKNKITSLEKRVSSIETKLSSLQTKVSSLQNDMKKVLKCVATENANFKIKHNRQSSSWSHL